MSVLSDLQNNTYHLSVTIFFTLLWSVGIALIIEAQKEILKIQDFQLRMRTKGKQSLPFVY